MQLDRTLHVWERSALEEDRRTLQRLAANENFCCLKVEDLFSVILVPGGLDDYDDDEEFVDDEMTRWRVGVVVGSRSYRKILR